MTMGIASFGIGAVQSVMQYSAQSSMYKQNAENAKKAFITQNKQENIRLIQEQEATSKQQFDNALKAREARATANVAASEAGVTGNSVDALMYDFYGREDRAAADMQSNLDWTVAQGQMDKEGFQAQYNDRIASVQPPSFADAMLRIASSGLNAMTTYNKATYKNKVA